jgi:mitochondrial inner membrane protease ATP23
MDSATPSPPERTPDLTGYTPDSPWSNTFNVFLGRMSSAGQNEFREEIYKKNEEVDAKNCEEWRDWCFNYSPTVIFLRKNIAALNGDISSKNVRCERCPARRDEGGKLHRQGGGFNPGAGILICSNEMRDRKHLEDTLSHELVHAWDELRWKVDWSDLRHAACSEVCSAIYWKLELGMGTN